MGVFDPRYVTEVLNDILSRHRLEIVITPKGGPGEPPKQDTESA